jgi:acyl-CoA thioesterase I
MKKRVVWAGIGIIIVVIAFFSFSDDSWEIKKPTAGENIIVFGDSLAEGVGSTVGNDLSSFLSKELGREVMNAGFAGDTTQSALSRLSDDVLSRNPRVVVVMLGGNDFLQRSSKQEIIGNLRQIIQKIQAQGAGVVLVGVRKIIFSSDYKKLAQETGSVYVANILDETFGEPALMSDQIHPNNAGYKIFAEKITPAVQQLLTQ